MSYTLDEILNKEERSCIEEFPLNLEKEDSSYIYEFTPAYDLLLINPKVVKKLASTTILEAYHRLQFNTSMPRDVINTTEPLDLDFNLENAIVSDRKITIISEYLLDQRRLSIALILSILGYQVVVNPDNFIIDVVTKKENTEELLGNKSNISILKESTKDQNHLHLRVLNYLLLTDSELVLRELIERLTPIPEVPFPSRLVPWRLYNYSEDLEKRGFKYLSYRHLTKDPLGYRTINGDCHYNPDPITTIIEKLGTNNPRSRIVREYVLNDRELVFWEITKEPIDFRSRWLPWLNYHELVFQPTNDSSTTVPATSSKNKFWKDSYGGSMVSGLLGHSSYILCRLTLDYRL